MLKPILLALAAAVIFAAMGCIAATRTFEVHWAVRSAVPNDTAIELSVGTSLRRPN